MKIICKDCMKELTFEIKQDGCYVSPCKKCLIKEYGNAYIKGWREHEALTLTLMEKKL